MLSSSKVYIKMEGPSSSPFSFFGQLGFSESQCPSGEIHRRSTSICDKLTENIFRDIVNCFELKHLVKLLNFDSCHLKGSHFDENVGRKKLLHPIFSYAALRDV